MRGVYDFLWFFVIYATLGWCSEVAFAAVKTGRFVNRGFLNGPVCPIYGFGVCAVVLCLEPFSRNIPLLFLLSVILTSLLEFVTGFVLEKLYHQKWWDYSERKFNIMGYICPLFLIIWGVACTAVMKLVHPLIAWVVGAVPLPVGIPLLCVALAGFLSDVSFTVVGMRRINSASKALERISGELHELSDELGEHIFEGVMSAMEKGDDIRESVEENHERIAERVRELKASVSEALGRGEFTRKRLVKAFPNLKKLERNKLYERLSELRDKYENR